MKVAGERRGQVAGERRAGASPAPTISSLAAVQPSLTHQRASPPSIRTQDIDTIILSFEPLYLTETLARLLLHFGSTHLHDQVS